MVHANLSTFITFAVGLIAILNPIGNAAIYIGMIDGRDKSEQHKIAFTCMIGIAVILVLVTWIGLPLLNFFGISIGAFQTAGGLIVLLIALDMIRAKQHNNDHHNAPEQKSAKEKDGIAIVPLAIPIIAGPGAISAIVANMHDMHTVSDKLMVSGIGIGCAVLMGIVLFFVPAIGRVLGEFGMKIVTRVMGLLLAAIAFQMLGDGLIALLPGLAAH